MAAVAKAQGSIPSIPAGLPPYFSEVQGLACGRFCNVFKVMDARTQKYVALKQPHSAFSDLHASRSTFREIRLLQMLQHGNVVALLDLFFVSNEENGTIDIFMAQELMQTDLQRALAVQRVDERCACYITHQILNALQYMHSRGIVHRDLRPSNVGINQDCTVKLFDFGMARFLPGGRPALTTMQSDIVGYTSPEALFGLSYDKKVDMWAVGCILGEMLEGFKLFDALTAQQLIAQWYRLLGVPPLVSEVGGAIYRHVNDMASIAAAEPSLQALFDGYADRMDSGQPRRWTALSNTARSSELLLRLLAYDSRERLSAEEALHNDFFRDYRDATLIEVGEGPGVETVEYWQKRVIEEVGQYMMSRLSMGAAAPSPLLLSPTMPPAPPFARGPSSGTLPGSQ